MSEQMAAAEGDRLSVPDRTGVEAQVVSYAVLHAYRTCDNYCAPLLALINAPSNEPLTVHGQRALLINPLQIEQYLQNWNMSWAAIGAFDIAVLKSDEAFGRFARSSLSESIGVLIAPIACRTRPC